MAFSQAAELVNAKSYFSLHLKTLPYPDLKLSFVFHLAPKIYLNGNEIRKSIESRSKATCKYYTLEMFGRQML